jgi:tetratricopeptide (TPR) repeat protein
LNNSGPEWFFGHLLNHLNLLNHHMSNRLTALLQLLEADARDSFTIFALAKEYETLGDDAEALRYYTRLQELDPGYVGLYYHLGKLYERMARPEAALSAYRQGLEAARKAGDRHAWSELQGAYLEAGGEEEE